MTLVTLLALLNSASAEEILFQDNVSGVSVDATGVDATVGTTGGPLDPGSFVAATPFQIAVPDEADVTHVYLVLMAKRDGFGDVTTSGVNVNDVSLESATLLSADIRYQTYQLDTGTFGISSASDTINYSEHSDVEADHHGGPGISGATIAVVFDAPTKSGLRHVVIAADDVADGISTVTGLPEATSTGDVVLSVAATFECSNDQANDVSLDGILLTEVAGGRDDGPEIEGGCGPFDWNSMITQGSFGYDDSDTLVGTEGDDPDGEPGDGTFNNSRLSDELYRAAYDQSGTVGLGYSDTDEDSRMGAWVLVFELDSDEDGLADAEDNCPTTYNPDQADVDGDGIGDVCDGCFDGDGDGYFSIDSIDPACEEDCDDSDPAIHPGATEIWYDGIDQDCDGASDYDADRDGADSDAFGGDDCDDTDPAFSPLLPEAWYDGIDQDCGLDDDYDADADGYVRDGDAGLVTAGVAGTGALPDGDCDDENPLANPGIVEIWYDGVDGDCDGGSDFDADLDGHDHEDYSGDDCDDTDGAINPDVEERWYDGIDSDCDDASDYDADRDLHDSQEYGGDDCDDTDSAINPSAIEVWYDGVDGDCDGESDYDADTDGFDSAEYSGDDCDDTDSSVHPSAIEIWYDGIDQDCDQGSDFDADQDGYDAITYEGDDCDDSQPEINPGATEIWYDGIDQDCDGANDKDADGDGFVDADDCDDGDPDVYPDAVGYRDCTKLNDLKDIFKGGGCSGCASSGGGTRGLGWLGLVGLLLGWRRRH